MKANVATLSFPNTSENKVSSTTGGFYHGPRKRQLRIEELQHTETLFSLFGKHLTSSMGNNRTTVKNALAGLRGVFHYIGLPPWEWVEDDISDFIHHKVTVSEIGMGRQAFYFTYLRAFQNYLFNSTGLCNGVHQKFGVQPQRFVTAQNSIPVKRKNHSRKEKITTLTGENCQRLMEQFDAEIRQAKLCAGKNYKTHRRNKVIAAVLLMTGVRIEECVCIRISDFDPDPKYPNFGQYALLTIVKGKGNKLRVVRLYNPMIKPLMDWYLTDVRPAFLSEKTSDPNLLFLSERGGKIVPEQIRKMLREMAALAGITTKVRPHILRHTYATQMKQHIGPEALQKQLGHEHLSTTLGTYYHQDPTEVGNQVLQGIQNFTNAIDTMTEGLFDEDHDKK
jgi:site-specific recombinase XerD